VAGGWRRLHNEGLHNLYSSLHIIRVIVSRRMRWACSTHGRDEKCIQNFGRKNPKGRDNSKDVGVDGRIILKWVSRNRGKIWTGFF
jgi:hypothetical protein